MAEEVQRRVIGDTAHLAFEVSWPRSEPADVRGLAWGGLVLWVGGQRHWSSGPEGERPVSWTWVDLVAHLGRAWAYLLYEETPPFGLVAFGPEDLRDPKLLASVPGRSATEIEDAVHAFQARHDLAAALKGIFLPAAWLVREGTTMRIRAAERDQWRPVGEVVETLEGLVRAILDRTGGQAAPRAEAAAQYWAARHPAPRRVLSLRTSLGEAELQALTPPGKASEAWWGNPEEPRDTPLMAAARLSAPLGNDARRAILHAIASAGTRETPELDALSDAAQPVLDATSGQKPYEQGHTLALWLRGSLGLTDEPVEPSEQLRRWNVHVADLEPVDENLDAMACWGVGHGPAVFVNPNGRHASSPGGRRATLCHEIAHLLLDRRRHLPAAEVFGGSTPLHLEQRARAFAAEVMLPREVAGRVVARAETVEGAADELQSTYGVSREVVAWQIRNGPGWNLLSRSDKRKVTAWCLPWRPTARKAPAHWRR